jgi:hypothetical protein
MCQTAVERGDVGVRALTRQLARDAVHRLERDLLGGAHGRGRLEPRVPEVVRPRGGDPQDGPSGARSLSVMIEP